jgi:predicted aspartyl protease
MSPYSRIFCAAAMGMLAAGSATGAPDCTLAKFGSIDLIGPATDIPVIAGEVNGTPVDFYVDTGAAFSLLSSTLGADLPTASIPRGMSFTDAAGEKATNVITVQDLTFGPFKLHQAQFLKSQSSALGANILDTFDVELDPVEHKLGLFEHKTCYGSPAYWPHSDLVVVPFEIEGLKQIIIPAKLDGMSFWALLDTGAAATALDEREARRLFGIDRNASGVESSAGGVAAGGKVISEYRGQFHKLEIGDLPCRRSSSG